MEAPERAQLKAGAQALGVELSAHHVQSLVRYAQLLIEWNRQINVTAVTEPSEIVSKHFVDSLAIQPLIGTARTLVDVGSGGGFPGLVLALLNPSLQVTCVESIHKKIAFLRAVSRELKLNTRCLAVRLEALNEPAGFDLVVSRATFDPPEWVERGAPLVAPGGRLVAMLGAERPALAAPPGFSAEPVRAYKIDGAARALAVFARES